MLSAEQQERLRSLPQVEEVLTQANIQETLKEVPREIVVEYVRESIDHLRSLIKQGDDIDVTIHAVVTETIKRSLALKKPSLHRVINASGVIIHTNLGRSALAEEAVQAVVDVARNYSTLEYNPESMSRGSRHTHCEQLICALTTAEAALAVNNNAAAVMMVLTEFASGHEAVVSRGELVEIGGSFRVPDIMRLSGADMVEIGTTNKTHLRDYEQAVSPETSLFLKVHPSNYRLIGFTESVAVDELRELADGLNETREKNNEPHIMVYEDQGSGALLRLECFGQYAEPTVAESIQAGCDLVSFSGDKLLGGPQAGIIVGKKEYIDRLKKNPLARALRLDKMTIAALETTLRMYLNEEKARRDIPTIRMLAATSDEVRKRAEKLYSSLSEAIPTTCATLTLSEEISRAGGGALPMCDIDTVAVSIEFVRGNAQDCERYLIAEREIPIVARIKKEAVICDARTIINDAEIAEIAQGFKEYFDTQADQ